MRLTPETVARYDVAGPRYTSYPTAPVWTPAHGPADHEAALLRAAKRPDEPLSLYVHIPFCKEKCLFCGCNTYITSDPTHPPHFIKALHEEAKRVARRLDPRRTLRQVHLGGGTPTHLQPGELEALLGPLFDIFPLEEEAEASVEVHPAVTSEDHLAVLAGLGFDRVSMGVQDFDPVVQQAIRRIQSPEATERLVQAARRLGFKGVNLDLIYGLPHQRPGPWSETLDHVLRIRPERIALYSYAHLPQRFKHQSAMPEEAMPKGREKVALFLEARRRFLEAGYVAIGFDHFAVPTDDLAVALGTERLQRNFMGYTTRAAPDLVALGPSAISSVAGTFAQNHHGLHDWYKVLEEGDTLPTERGMRLDTDDLVRRDTIEGFLCRFRMDPDRLFADHGKAAVPVIEEMRAMAPAWIAAGLIREDEGAYEATELGRLFARNVAMGLDAYLQRTDGQAVYSRTV